MKKVNNLVLYLMTVTLLVACNQNKKVTTGSGLTYEYLESGDGDFVNKGEFYLLNIVGKDKNDSIWLSSIERGAPTIIPKKDSIWKMNDGSINEIIYQLVKGDSITFDIDAASLFTKTYYAQLPKHIPGNTIVTFNVGVEDVLNKEEMTLYQKIQRLKYEKKMEESRIKQDSLDQITIKEYLVENNIDAKETESGLHYVILEEGSGEYPKDGDNVVVNYTGKLLNGGYFDSSIKSKAEEIGSYDARREPYEPFQFTLGTRSVIRGWDEGIKLIRPGAKALLFIPSGLGYGARSMGPKIPANSILLFEVELLEIANENQ